MLSNLASYLMGGSTTVPSVSASSASTDIAQGPVLPEKELRCTEDEDWLVVDQDAQSESILCTDAPSASDGPSLPISITPTGDRHDESMEDDEEDDENCMPVTGLAESWYVEPSACIARRRPKLATSPLENLLIEHPSMSVYHHSIREDDSSETVSPVPTIEEEEDIDEVSSHIGHVMEDIEVTRTRQVIRLNELKVCRVKHHQYQVKNKDLTATATPTVPHLKSQKIIMEAAMLGGRVSQKKDKVSRSQLERLNKCKSSSGHKLRRSDRQHATKNSNANNNRKCSQRLC